MICWMKATKGEKTIYRMKGTRRCTLMQGNGKVEIFKQWVLGCYGSRSEGLVMSIHNREPSMSIKGAYGVVLSM